jgi:hypothetical protein
LRTRMAHCPRARMNRQGLEERNQIDLRRRSVQSYGDFG